MRFFQKETKTDNAEPSSKHREVVTTGHGAPKWINALSKLKGLSRPATKNRAKKHQKPTATAFCINIHNSTKYAICMHKANKTLEKGYKYTRPTFHYTHLFKHNLKILDSF